MKIQQFSYPEIQELIKPYLANGRSESASFLIWYLVNIYRLDVVEAIDAVCDQRGDKGVDGIYVNDSNGTIDIFQCKLFQNMEKKVGDVALKEFSGTLSQFASAESITQLVKDAGNHPLSKLILSKNIAELVSSYSIKGVYLTNTSIDANAFAYLAHAGNVETIDPTEIISRYVSDEKDAVQQGKANFDISGLSRTTYAVDKDTHTVIAPVLASELLKLKGITDQSLFSLNVRANLGNTKVNKDISKSIKDTSLHKLFPLFHNGITVLAESVASTDENILIENYYVVNGCQSLNALYKNIKDITADLRILTKFIQVPAQSQLSELITTNSNNQNGVKARDFKSNNPIQTRLQNEMQKDFKNRFVYEVKRGEPLETGVVISNENAGLYLIAFDLREPWTTHRRYQVFEEKHVDIFGRPEVTASRIVFLQILIDEIKPHVEKLSNQLVGKYLLTQFFILYVLRRIFEEDDFGKNLLIHPEEFVKDVETSEKLRKVIDKVLTEIMIDFNLETKDLGEDFDYRGNLRDKEYISEMTNKLLASFLKDIARGKSQPLSAIWNSVNQSPA